MKWIGQHIYDLIARFRNDVYLENISTGTIASGGNLGLDSNNKIVKADVPADGDITGISFRPDDANTVGFTSGSADFVLVGSTGIKTTGDGSSTLTLAVDFADDEQATFGANNDLKIYHNSSLARNIIDNDVGDLYINQNADDKDIVFRCDDGSGGTTTYFMLDGSTTTNKFSEKIEVYKADATANPRVSIGRSSGEAINFDVEDRTARIYHKQDETTGSHDLKITVDSDTSDTKDIHLGFRDSDGSNESIKFTLDENGNVGIGTTSPGNKLEVHSGTTNVAGVFKSSDNQAWISVQDDASGTYGALFGTDSDANHDIVLADRSANKRLVISTTTGNVGIATTSPGEKLEVNGNIKIGDSDVVKIGDGNDFTATHDGTDTFLGNNTGDLYVTQQADDKDIIFRGDDGSGGVTPYLTLDGSLSRLQVDKNMLFVDSRAAFFGDSQDLQIYHDGSNSYIKDTGTGNLRIDSTNLHFRNAAGTKIYASGIDGGAFSLRHDNSTKLETTSTGVEVTGNISLTGSVQKQIQVFPMNFVDDLGTDKHFMPFVTNTEQTVNYQEEAAMVMPADGRVVSVTVHYAQMHGSDGNITVGIETSPCGQAYTNTWDIEETETIAASVDDDHHVFHFAFDNAKHFESTDKMAISIQQSTAMQNAGRFFWVTAVIEYDWSTFLGGTSAEHTTTP